MQLNNNPMALNSRNKGAAAERDVAKLLFDQLGVKLKRNLEQTRSGGHDLISDEVGLLDAYAIEIKRYAKVTHALVDRFWDQACRQAEAVGKTPVLIFRGDREEWRVALPLSLLFEKVFDSQTSSEFGIFSFHAFCKLMREW